MSVLAVALHRTKTDRTTDGIYNEETRPNTPASNDGKNHEVNDQESLNQRVSALF